VSGKVYVKGAGVVLTQGKVYVKGTSLSDSAATADVGDEILILDEDDITDNENIPPPDFTPIVVITGKTAGTHTTVPPGFLSNNFNLHYKTGNITIRKATLKLQIRDSVITYGANAPKIRYDLTGFKLDDSVG
jgi:hypothetical protein